jgi:hypothetical protein
MNYKVYLLGLATALCAVGCSDVQDEITSLTTDRNFSPINVTATVRNKTSVELSWTKSSKVDTYTVELFANDSLNFGGTPALTIEGITTDDLPYTVTDLLGETRYSARVKALSSSRDESKWTGVTFKTDAEQIFYAVADEDLAATSVTLRWPAGQSADVITLTPGDITHNITAAEIAAGAATIEGLTGETTYTAVMKRGTSTRGTVKFKTLVDAGDATVVNEGDDFATILANAKEGASFAFMPGEYNLGNVSFTKSVSIKALKTEQPVLKMLVSLEENISVTLENVILDGLGINTEVAGTNGDQAIQFNGANSQYGDVTVEGCTIRNWKKGIVYFAKTAGYANSLTFNNCVMYNIECNGGDFLDCRVGTAKTINFTNNTVYGSCAARDFIRIDDNSSNVAGVAPVVKVDHNTLYNVANNSSKRLLYVRWAGNSITFSNNIVANTAGYFTNQKATSITWSNNDYFSAAGCLENSTSNAKVDDSGTALQLDPQFKDAAGGDFTVGNQAVIDAGLGDPRWIK